MNNDHRKGDASRGPITGASGAGRYGKGKGPGMIVAGPAARAAAGTVAEPSSRAVTDGSAEERVATAVDPAGERAYWSENFSGRNCVKQGSSFDDCSPAGKGDMAPLCASP